MYGSRVAYRLAAGLLEYSADMNFRNYGNPLFGLQLLPRQQMFDKARDKERKRPKRRMNRLNADHEYE